MAAFLDACRFFPTAGGTTDWTYSSAVTGYQSPAAANVVNGRLYKYRAESADLSQWEIGEGAYNTGTGVLARTTVLFNSAGTTAKISFSAAPQVAVVALKEDLISIEEANAFTSTQKDQAGKNLGLVRAVRVQKFTANGTYTPDANLLYAIIECVGGGGGGGGSSGSVNALFIGAGGNSGGYSRKYVTAATIGASQTVTIGAAGAGGVGITIGSAGGDTSVGALCIAKGGPAGLGASGALIPSPSAAAVAGTGDLAAAGNVGQGGAYVNVAGTFSPSGAGASSVFGGGAPATSIANGAAASGVAAGAYGAGGSGGASPNVAAGSNGGAGSAGLVIITEFCSA